MSRHLRDRGIACSRFFTWGLERVTGRAKPEGVGPVLVVWCRGGALARVLAWDWLGFWTCDGFLGSSTVTRFEDLRRILLHTLPLERDPDMDVMAKVVASS